MTQSEIMQKTFDQMDHVFTSNEFKVAYLENGGYEKLAKHKVLQFIKRLAVQQDPNGIRCRTWIKKDSQSPALTTFTERDVIQYLKDNAGAEDLCVRFLKHRGYRVLKSVEVEL